jgi:hypothetical protein
MSKRTIIITLVIIGLTIPIFLLISANRNKTAFAIAIEEGKADEISKMLDRGFDVNSVLDFRTCLTAAMYEGRIDIIKLLLKAGADVHKADIDGDLPISWVARTNGDAPKILELLLQYGANIDKQNEEGETLLMRLSGASNERSIEALKILLEKKANLDLQDKEGMTALMHAAHDGNSYGVRLLLLKGANPHLANIKGKTALMLAKENNSCGMGVGIPRLFEVPITSLNPNVEPYDCVFTRDEESRGKSGPNDFFVSLSQFAPEGVKIKYSAHLHVPNEVERVNVLHSETMDIITSSIASKQKILHQLEEPSGREALADEIKIKLNALYKTDLVKKVAFPFFTILRPPAESSKGESADLK